MINIRNFKKNLKMKMIFDALRAAGDSNSDKLIKLAEEIGKDELIAIVLDYDFSLYDYSLKWAINQILN